MFPFVLFSIQQHIDIKSERSQTHDRKYSTCEVTVHNGFSIEWNDSIAAVLLLADDHVSENRKQLSWLQFRVTVLQATIMWLCKMYNRSRQ